MHPTSEGVASPQALRWMFALGVALLFWSFVGALCYLAFVARAPQVHVDALDEARRRALRGDVAGALKEYRAFARISPFESNAFNEMGELLLRSGDVDEAGAAFEAALRVRHRDTQALERLGDVRLAQRRYPEAVSLYDAALSLSSSARSELVSKRERAWREQAHGGGRRP